MKMLSLLDGNVIYLSPRGSFDVKGPTDCGILLDDEMQCEDVKSFLQNGWVSIEPIKQPCLDIIENNTELVAKEENLWLNS